MPMITNVTAIERRAADEGGTGFFGSFMEHTLVTSVSL
jgi:hypothetical protein